MRATIQAHTSFDVCGLQLASAQTAADAGQQTSGKLCIMCTFLDNCHMCAHDPQQMMQIFRPKQ